MDLITLIAVLLLVMFAILAGGMWIALSLAVVGFVAMTLQVSAPAGSVLAISAWQSATSWDLTALPMFIWMGEILYRTRLSEDLFRGLAPWLGRFPGRLLHVNVAACTVFAAVSGSSAATCATIGRISLPELARRGYDQRISIGSLAGAGTLGLLIPPSIILIVYAAATEQSIIQLFLAGVMPGLLIAALFMSFIAVWALFNRHRMPPAEPVTTFVERLSESRRLIPVILIIVFTIGSIYAGIASATEAAVVGVLLSLGLSWWVGSLDRESFSTALMRATMTSCMIAFILSGAAFLTVAMGYTGIPRALAGLIAEHDLARWQLLVALTVLYVVLGCFLDGISIVVLTTSVIIPMVDSAGINLIWFGIFLVLVVEMAQITPPVGFNLFVLQGLTGLNIFSIALYTFPFFVLLAVTAVLLATFPEIALWLPSRMMSSP
jgi:tripartite ATP-independent transporter DctM subunit